MSDPYPSPRELGEIDDFHAYIREQLAELRKRPLFEPYKASKWETAAMIAVIVAGCVGGACFGWIVGDVLARPPQPQPIIVEYHPCPAPPAVKSR
jgi:hypothetical protein